MTTMTASPIADELRRVGACSDAVRFYEAFDGDAQRAWTTCERGDWMLWLTGRSFRYKTPESPARRLLTLVAVECAATALPHAKDPRVAACLVTAWRWGVGDPDVTLDDVREAQRAAAYAAYAAYAANAAAYAAADAAYAANAAAADDAANAADDAAYARRKRLAECADIVRLWFPEPVAP